MEWTAYLLADAAGHTPGHPWNLRSPCRRERPSVPVKATLQRDDSKCERPVASDDHLYKSNEFGLLPIKPIVRTLAAQILTGIERSDRFSGTLLPWGCCYDCSSLQSLLAFVSMGVLYCNTCANDASGRRKFPKKDRLDLSNLYPVLHVRCKLSSLTNRMPVSLPPGFASNGAFYKESAIFSKRIANRC